jgi:tetratricopeptide (TPR) repeat protein
MEDPVKAEEYYRRATEVKPDFFEAYYNIGAIYNNKAAQLTQAANNLPLDQVDEYNKLIDEANKSLEEAMPYLEKALEINPEDQLTIQALKEVYTRLKMNDKLESLNE